MTQNHTKEAPHNTEKKPPIFGGVEVFIPTYMTSYVIVLIPL